MKMSYENFLKNIDDFVGKHVIILAKNKFNGEMGIGCAIKIWDNKTFMPLREDSLIEILEVEVIQLKTTF